MAGADVSTPKKSVWSHQVESTLSQIGFAVGLANFWRFPYLCMRNGGGAFLIPYTIFMILCGLPLFYLELSLGQFSGLGPVTMWEICPLFKGVGWGMVVVSAICCVYFIIPITWSMYYLGMSLRREVPWKTCDNDWNTQTCYVLGENSSRRLNISEQNLNVSGSYTNASTSAEEFWIHKVLNISDGIENMGIIKWDLAICLLVTWLLVYVCLCKGIKSSGKAVYVTVPLPYIMLTVLLARGLTLPGSLDGIKYYIIPDWSKLATFSVWSDASIQVFYTLGPTWGGIQTLSSYNRFHNNCLRDALIATFSCGGTSLYIGLAIFSILGYMAHEAGTDIEHVIRQGPGLAYIAYPEGIASLPASPIWAVCLFLAVISLCMDGQFVMLETVITGLSDEFPKYLGKRKTVVATVVCFILFLLGLPLVTRGGMYLFQVIDWYLAIVSLMIFGAFECLTVGYIYGIGQFCSDLTVMCKRRPNYYWVVCWCGVIPIILVGMLVINCTWVSPPTYGSYKYPPWAEVLGWFIALASVAPIPLLAVHQLITTPGSLSQRLQQLLRPGPKWRPQCTYKYLDAYTRHRAERQSWSEKMKFNDFSKIVDLDETEELRLTDENHHSAVANGQSNMLNTNIKM